MMNEEIRETLSTISIILQGLGTKIPVSLLNQFLSEDGENQISNSELNESLNEYIKEYLDKDVQSQSRIVKIGELYIPLPAIHKWQIDEKYSYVDSCLKYRIIFNATEGTPGPFNNIVAVYNSKEEREKDIEKLIEMKLSWTQI